MRGSETILIHRAAASATDRFGQTDPGEGGREVPGCIIVPRTSSETDDRQETVIVGLTVYAPPLTNIRSSDEVTARGTRWRVIGEPGDYRNAAGRRKTVAIALERTE